jgi:hypothetical protein
MAMRRNRKKAFGVPDMRTHDLRRTMRTFLGEQGVPDEVADRVLNHARPGVGNQHYNHAKMLPQVRGAFELWATHIETACSDEAAKRPAAVEDARAAVPPADEAVSICAIPLAAA